MYVHIYINIHTCANACMCICMYHIHLYWIYMYISTLHPTCTETGYQSDSGARRLVWPSRGQDRNAVLLLMPHAHVALLMPAAPGQGRKRCQQTQVSSTGAGLAKTRPCRGHQPNLINRTNSGNIQASSPPCTFKTSYEPHSKPLLWEGTFSWSPGRLRRPSKSTMA